ncbi:MAG TPA: glycosyltransferase 87 family protein [Pirellulales bacterium]|nr:glycosyltransferase 87 family protein [Pirellulales bacterium]
MEGPTAKEEVNAAVPPPSTSLRSHLSWLTARERRLRVVVVLIGLAIFTLQWVRAGARVDDGDFPLHWKFAGRLLGHELLYAEGLHVPYLPFWAVAWLPIAGLPLAVAKVVCYPLSAVGLALLLWLLDRMCRTRLAMSDIKRFWVAVGALAIVSRFVVRELPECGPNLMLLGCVWSAIYLWTERRDLSAGLCLGFATALKCTPGLFIAYFAWKRQWRVAASAIVSAVVFTLSPALWQGPTDYQRHMQIWLANLRFGLDQPDPSFGVLGPETLQNLSLRPAVARFLMHLPAGHPGRIDQPAHVDLLNLSPTTAGRATKGIVFALLAVVAWTFRKPAVRRDDLVVVWECAGVGALSLLLSPITWYQHCVALLPVFYLFLRSIAAGLRPARWMVAVLAAFLLIVVALNRGLIGRDATMLMASYHLTTWAILGALGLAMGGRAAMAKGASPVDVADEQSYGFHSFSFSALADMRLRWTTAFVVIGLILRIYHYLRNPSLWHDEAALVVNVLEKGFVELLGPLRFSEAAPPLFLWLEKSVVLALGESMFALRLWPLVASCAALVLFVPIARRTLAPAAVPWAVLLFAVSDRLLWHACEAKQYSIEVFVAVSLLATWLTTSDWTRWRRSLCFALLAPPLLCVAYPAAFLYGGVLVALLRELWPSRRVSDWVAYGVLVITVFATFGALLVGPIHAQRDETILQCWNAMSQFPDWTNPAGVPGWMARSTCELIGYCIKPVGEWLAPLAIVGLIVFWRHGKQDWCILLALPILLALLASCLKAYPYGGMRVMCYSAPAVFLFVAAAVPVCLQRLTQRHLWAAAPLAALLMVPAARAAYCVVRPWERADCASAAAYVTEHRQPTEMVTANHWEYRYYFRDLGHGFTPIEEMARVSDRMWVVVTGALSSDREPCLALFSGPQWTTLDRHEFDRTTVLLVQRRTDSTGPVALRPERPALPTSVPQANSD